MLLIKANHESAVDVTLTSYRICRPTRFLHQFQVYFTDITQMIKLFRSQVWFKSHYHISCEAQQKHRKQCRWALHRGSVTERRMTKIIKFHLQLPLITVHVAGEQVRCSEACWNAWWKRQLVVTQSKGNISANPKEQRLIGEFIFVIRAWQIKSVL